MATEPKKIVYLIGAGATQAEVSYRGAKPLNLLMKSNLKLGEGVSEGVLKKCNADSRALLDQDSGDIEKLISLLSGSGVQKFIKLAQDMRTAYFEEIRDRLAESKVIDNPALARALFEMHSIDQFATSHESLSGVITTNHDGLLQLASQQVFGGLNLGFPFKSSRFSCKTDEQSPPILQLHGSFSWRFDRPIWIRPLKDNTRYEPNTVWIPPTVLKEAKTYPFGKLAGRAYELLAQECDVLRVIGASLTQNDWNILSLIFHAQLHQEFDNTNAFKIELIMSHKGGEWIGKECSFLRNLTSFGYLTDGKFDDFLDENFKPDEQMKNSFSYWLIQKLSYHSKNGHFGNLPYPDTVTELLGE